MVNDQHFNHTFWLYFIGIFELPLNIQFHTDGAYEHLGFSASYEYLRLRGKVIYNYHSVKELLLSLYKNEMLCLNHVFVNDCQRKKNHFIHFQSG